MIAREKSDAPDQEGGDGLQAEAAKSGGLSFGDLMAEAISIEPDAPAEEDVAPAETAPATKATDPASTTAPAPAEAPPAEPAATAARADQTKSDAPAAPPAEPSGKTGEKPAETSPKVESGSTPEPVAFTFKVDGREVKLMGAHEDGENIVVPKKVWHSEMKNFLADRAAISRREQQFRAEVKKLAEERGAGETVAEAMMQELNRIVNLPDVESFDEWEKFRAGFTRKLAEAERDYWKAQTTGRQQADVQAQTEAEMREFIPVLQKEVRKFADQAMESVKSQLTELSADELTAWGDRLHDLLLDEADGGRIFYTKKDGSKIPGTNLPQLDVDFQRIASVVEREVRLVRNTLERQAGMKKSLAEVEAAARANAEAEARRRGVMTPPPVSTLTTTAGPVSDAAARSWDDLVADAVNS